MAKQDKRSNDDSCLISLAELKRLAAEREAELAAAEQAERERQERERVAAQQAAEQAAREAREAHAAKERAAQLEEIELEARLEREKAVAIERARETARARTQQLELELAQREAERIANTQRQERRSRFMAGLYVAAMVAFLGLTGGGTYYFTHVAQQSADSVTLQNDLEQARRAVADLEARDRVRNGNVADAEKQLDATRKAHQAAAGVPQPAPEATAIPAASVTTEPAPTTPPVTPPATPPGELIQTPPETCVDDGDPLNPCFGR